MKNQCLKYWLLVLLFVGTAAVPRRAQGAAGPASIATPPASITVLQGNSATFSVVADGTPPFTYQWLRAGEAMANATNSSYALSPTVATDNGAQFSVIVTNALGGATSVVATLTIDPGVAGSSYATNGLINLSTQVWRYFTNGTDLGTEWSAPGYNDSSWPAGQGLLGVETTPAVYTEPFRTAFPSFNQPTITYYFRSHFTFAPTGNVYGVTMNVSSYVDDGAVFFLNGVEVGRVRLTASPQTYLTLADGTIAVEGTVDAFTFAATSLLPGDNVLAVEVHQVNNASSDIVFGMGMDGTIVNRVPDTIAPTVVSTDPPIGAIVTHLNEIEIQFGEAVQGVDASDLLINGIPASSLTFGVPGQFVFGFPAPASTGQVTVAWAPGHNIRDLATTPNNFVASGSWSYTFNPNAVPAAFIINEFLASNDRGIRDENGDHSDWIEILNPGLVAGNLGGWFLTDDPFNLAKWRFPSTALDAGKFLLVFASGKDRTNLMAGTAFTNLHTSFGLNSGAGYLALVDPGTNIISTFGTSYPPQSTDISYGRDRVDPNLTGFFQTPTPRAANSTSGPGIAPEVHFSVSSRTFIQGSPMPLTLSTPGVTNATIYYALGTNVPSTSSLRYTNTLNLTNTTFIRARAFVSGFLPGPITTESYIALTNTTNVVRFNSGLPIVILHNNGGGTVPSATDQPVFIQTFEPDLGRASLTNRPNLTGRGVFHLRGSSTLGYAKGSFFLEFRDEANNDKDVPMLGLPEQSDWVLYAPNNFEPALFHNPLAHALFRDQGRYGSRTRFVVVYLKDDTGNPGPVTDLDYNGVYVLEEKVKRDKNRVDIDRLDPEDITAPAVTGGYIFAIDRVPSGEGTLNAGGASLVWIEPSYGEMIQPARAPQLSYIQGYFNSFGTALNGVNWTNPATGYAAYIDVDSWIDLHIHETLTFNVDGLRLSGYLYKPRNGKIRYGPTWDYDRTQGSTDGRDANPRTWRSTVPDLGTDFFNFNPWWQKLLSAPDFWQNWIDRYQELRQPGNAFSTNVIYAHLDDFYNQLVQDQPRERTRWNIATRGTNGAGSGTYADEVQWKRHWYSSRLGFADTNFLAPPAFDIFPGPQSNTVIVTVNPVSGLGDKRANSQLIMTLDGTDPRLSGGAIRTGPNVLSNTGPITVTISNTVRIFARSRNPVHVNLTGANNPPITSPWSGPATGTYYYPATTPPLRITEIMYHPPVPPVGNTNDADNYEYIELKNISSTPLSLNRYRLRGGVEFDFPDILVNGGNSVVVVADIAAFQARYGGGIVVAGAYTNNPSQNRLGNGGDHLILEGAYREPILDFKFQDSWYPTTDGAGFALQIVDENLPTAAWGLKTSWRPSGQVSGSPGNSDPGAITVAPVYINEILTHTDPPQSDAIELYNPNDSAAAVGGWYLTDDFEAPKKFRVALGTTIPAHAYLVLYATNAIGSNAFGGAFQLSSKGDQIYLFSGDLAGNLTGFVQGFDFGAQANGVTFGRYIVSTGNDQYPTQTAPTLGVANSLPEVGPIVISEINYRPPDVATLEGPLDNVRDEYIELENITGVSQPLYDPNFPTNTWRLRDAVAFEFPTNVVIEPHGHVLLVSFDPSEAVEADRFRTVNSVFAGTPLFGPYQGKLDNSGDSVELIRPDVPQLPNAPDANEVYYILADKVAYQDAAPWSIAADGTGFSLQRIVPDGYGNDPTNWAGDLKTAGFSYGPGNGPVITSQPQSATVVASLTATFSITATGAPPISYQWRRNGVGLAGANNSVLLLPNVQLSQAGQYDCIVQNPGGVSVSSNATLTVLMSANIIVQPQPINLRGSSNTVDYGNTTNNATFNVLANGTGPVSYQWRFNGTPIAAATGTSYSINNVQLVHDGVYDVLVTDNIGTIPSAPARLSVLITPTILQPPLAQTVPAGSRVNLSVVVKGNPPPFGYQWRSNSLVMPLIVSEAQSNYFSITAATNPVTATYRIVVTNAASQGNGVAIAFNITTVADTDLDGVPDTVETALGLDLNNPADGAADMDHDGVSNRDEYIAGTDLANAASYLRVDQVTVPGTATIKVAAVSNRTYSVQYTGTLPTGTWQKLADILARPTNHVEMISDPSWSTNRFYRITLPAVSP